MSEVDIIEQLSGFTDTVLVGISVFFTVISAYVAALNYFIRRASVLGRVAAFLFVSFMLALLVAVMAGAQATHDGLIAALREQMPNGLSAAGRAALANADATIMTFEGGHYTIDAIVRIGLWGGLAMTYFGLFFLTFVFRWGDED